MRKIVVSNMTSLDGYIAGPAGELDWHLVDADFIKYSEEMLDAADLILFGRITYELMAAYWPQPENIKNDPIVAAKMNGLPKIVFSRTMKKANPMAIGWENTTLVNDNLKENLTKLKHQPGKDILILGSGSIVAALTQMGLIDEYRFIINPVILGAGKPQFTGDVDRAKLTLTGMAKLASGVVILTYEPIK
jgi:dihydrofolate reductase